MTEAGEDNIGTVDKIMYLVKQDDQALVPDTDNDNDDLHVCRKCKKVFQSLASYLEHKVKYENYNISETLSKLDQLRILSHLGEKKKESEEELECARQNEAVTLTHLKGKKSASLVNVDCEWPLDESLGKKESVAELEEKKIKDPVQKNKDRKRKSLVQEVLSAHADLEISYMCTICDKKFRREASLRWHMNFGHQGGKKNDRNSVGQIIVEDSAENENISIDIVKKEKDSYNSVDDQEVHVIIKQSQNIGKLEATEDLQHRDVSSSQHKQAVIKKAKEVKNKDLERPHVCCICDQSFKKMTALKTHGAVHSDDRKFVCTFKDCPYGFKLKGGLVRHMRRHTGERPYICENCGRAFSESGALTRHMKSRLNCARRPGSAYPHYMKNWTYHPNIPAVLDPSQRDVHQRRNKVFGSLAEYSEHKSKFDNSHNHRTRSNLDHINLHPEQKQNRLKNPKNADHIRKGKCKTPTIVNIMKSTSLANGCELPLDTRKEESIVGLNQKKNLIQDPLLGKRGRKRKSVESNVLITQSDLEVSYTCTECDKKFRRKTSLCRHMKNVHKEDKTKWKDSNQELTVEAFAGNDKDYKDAIEVEKNNDYHSEKDEHETSQEIHIIIEQSENCDAGNLQTGDVSSQSLKEIITDCDREENTGRPFMCDICGQRFKKMTALKTHGAVHSDDRKFVCTFKDCPYGFKLKGGLVRHMRRHTGERPYVCENCGRAFSESGALTRHMKSRRNCARTPDSAYHRYMRNWTYHPNIPAVMDPFQRGVHQEQCSAGGKMGVNPQPCLNAPNNIYPLTAKEWNLNIGEQNDTTDIIIEVSDKIIKPLDLVLAQETAATAITQQILDNHTGTADTSFQGHADFYLSHIPGLVDITSGSEVQFLKFMQCWVCRKDLGTVEGLEIHLQSHLADQPSHCGFCHFLSHDQEELRHHILSMHHGSLKDIEASVLSMTEEGEEMKSEAIQDKETATRDALIAVKQLYSLKKHKSSNELDKDKSANGRLQCMVCNRFFALRSYLQQHMRTHIGDRPYKCHVCQRSFTARDVLKKHMFVHKEQRDFKCGECGKLFKRLTYLQQHLKIHTQERTLECSLCDKMFRTQYSLTVHMRTHSGINPYKCHVCNKHFRERGSLRRHMRLHAGEKPYKCPLCNRAFAENGTLSRHLKAKVPCSTKQIKLSVANLDHNQDDNSNLLTQFSAVVANTQQYIQHVTSGQPFCLPAMHEGQETETLHIFDTDISESVIIVAEKEIVELIR